jgi:hypothetical protein
MFIVSHPLESGQALQTGRQGSGVYPFYRFCHSLYEGRNRDARAPGDWAEGKDAILHEELFLYLG